MNRFVLSGLRQKRPVGIAARWLQPLLLGLLAASASVHAIQPDMGTSKPKLSRAFLAPELQVQPELEASVTLGERSTSHPAALNFLSRHPGTWEMRWDRRADRPNLIQGSGVPLIPGLGNSLSTASLGLRSGETVDMAVVETRLLDFIAENSDLLKTAGLEFQLDPQGSVVYGEGNTHWFIELAQSKNGVKVRGANLFFRISNGNIVQFGSNLVAPVETDTIPVSRPVKAFDLAFAELGFPAETKVVEWLQQGELQLLPFAADGKQAGEGFSGADGSGYSHRLAWHFSFRVNGDATTYDMRVDAKTNRVIDVGALDSNVSAVVDGGIFETVNTLPEVIKPMPFAAVTNGTAKVTDALGIYDYSGGAASVTFDGKFFKMTDTCGSISLSNSSDGNLHLGTDTSTDCGAAGGVGGAGNTRASRNGFYYLTRINRKAATFLPGNSWIAGKVTANMNVNDVCNANWNGSSMNFFKSGSLQSYVCANTGELPGVFLHEWGHGMDQNSGGGANEQGSGEAVGDTFAFLETKEACIGNGFFTSAGVNGCTNCASTCSGVRDLNAFSTLGARVIAKPSNVGADNGINCDRLACPYLVNGFQAYQGPMGYEGHCESYIAGSANWDLAQALVSAHGSTAGWAQMDKIWYASLTPSKSAYQVASGGKCNANATVNGCGANNWYTVYLAADDNDGNLANGTPNACRIWDAFNAHGIACGTRPACSGGGGGNVPPVANFSSSTSGLTASFTDSSTDSDGTIASRAWNFGDGGTSTATNPSRTYAAAGTYTVTLTVTDNSGATNTKSASVTVSSGGGNNPQTYSNPTDFSITDNSTVNSPITVSGRSGNAPANASVTVAIVHTYQGDLKVDLVAPDGTLYNIHNRTGAGTDNINKTVTLNLSSEALNGTWNLRVNDNGPNDIGKIDSWSITF